MWWLAVDFAFSVFLVCTWSKFNTWICPVFTHSDPIWRLYFSTSLWRKSLLFQNESIHLHYPWSEEYLGYKELACHFFPLIPMVRLKKLVFLLWLSYWPFCCPSLYFTFMSFFDMWNDSAGRQFMIKDLTVHFKLLLSPRYIFQTAGSACKSS